MAMSETVVRGSAGNAVSYAWRARHDSGLFVGLPSVVRCPGRSSATAASESTMKAIHVPITRQGCRAQARATPCVGRPRHAARRSCSSRPIGDTPKVSIAGVVSQTWSPPSTSIVSWSRVIGAHGSQSVSVAPARMRPTGRCTVGRRFPSTFRMRSKSSFHVTASGPPSSNVCPAAAAVDALGEERRDVVDPDRLQATVPGADDRRHR